jgi:hypothetical protein
MRTWTRIAVVLFLTMVGVALLNADVEWLVLTRWPFRDAPDRVAVYEATIRYLARQPDAGGRIVVSDRICAVIDHGPCDDELSPEELEALRSRLTDLGQVELVPAADIEHPPATEQMRSPRTYITLGPVTDGSEGTRVQAGTWCGNVCGVGAVYVVERTDDGFTITGTDPSYPVWVS